jgi:hypothetical protein
MNDHSVMKLVQLAAHAGKDNLSVHTNFQWGRLARKLWSMANNVCGRNCAHTDLSSTRCVVSVRLRQHRCSAASDEVTTTELCWANIPLLGKMDLQTRSFHGKARFTKTWVFWTPFSIPTFHDVRSDRAMSSRPQTTCVDADTGRLNDRCHLASEYTTRSSVSPPKLSLDKILSKPEEESNVTTQKRRPANLSTAPVYLTQNQMGTWQTSSLHSG